MHTIPAQKDPVQPQLGDCLTAPTTRTPKPDPAPRAFMNELRKILCGLSGR
jgi:hypothetical protein